jgi:hypothetical protein
MQLIHKLRQRVGSALGLFEEEKRIGIYGPPNSGKSTLANRISNEWKGEQLGVTNEVPHETRRAKKKDDITITYEENEVTIDIVDTPGMATKVDEQEFLSYNMDEESANMRAREATEGIAEAMHWLREDIDGVIYMMDSTKDPFLETNTMIIGIIESQNIPTVVVANKTDLDDSEPQSVSDAFPQHDMVAISAKEGNNMEELYKKITENFG